jgi:hypothetical protein
MLSLTRWVEETSYHSAMRFEAAQASEMLGPLLVEQALSDIPIFGEERAGIEETIEKALKVDATAAVVAEQTDAITTPLPESSYHPNTIATRLRSLRAFARSESGSLDATKGDAGRMTDSDILRAESKELSLAATGLKSCREIHESVVSTLLTASGLPSEAQCVVDHAMILRAKEKYLFDAAINTEVVADDPWLKYVWDWVADAEAAADDSGMVISNVDLSYLGVHSIWKNDLGRYSVSARDAAMLINNPSQATTQNTVY